jgi:hypothetical protein
LPFCDGMRTLFLLLAFVLTATRPALAQEPLAADGTKISVAGVTGIPFDQLSPELRADISALAGSSLRRERLQELAQRIEREKPEMFAAPRSETLPDGSVSIAFVVARISDDPELLANINARYVIESVSVTPKFEPALPKPVIDELQALKGKRLDPEEGKRLSKKIADSLTGYGQLDVKPRFERGGQPGQLRVVFEVLETDSWLGFSPLRGTTPKFVYHAYQGWSAAVDIPITGDDIQFTFGFAIANEDDLIEQYSGVRIRFASRNVGTKRLGAGIELSHYGQSWREATLFAVHADPTIPQAYDGRTTVEPTLTFAFNRHFRVTGGVSVSELETLVPLDPLNPPDPVELPESGDSVMASVGLVGASFDKQWPAGVGRSHEVTGSYELRVASEGLGSDLDYTRHLAAADYQFRNGRSSLLAGARFGRSHGSVPLFERFALGDTGTLRGFNKFDISPAGGTRLVYSTVEYRWRCAAVFVDAGSVWDASTDASVRWSTGFGCHGKNFFMTFAVPLNSDDVDVTFMMGVRF